MGHEHMSTCHRLPPAEARSNGPERHRTIRHTAGREAKSSDSSRLRLPSSLNMCIQNVFSNSRPLILSAGCAAHKSYLTDSFYILSFKQSSFITQLLFPVRPGQDQVVSNLMVKENVEMSAEMSKLGDRKSVV